MSLNEGTDTRRRADVVTTRYGVFLTPDPATCAAVSTVTGLIRAQYGFVSAAAFPPHATLAGSQTQADRFASARTADAAPPAQADPSAWGLPYEPLAVDFGR
jgi:hypothetical protein